MEKRKLLFLGALVILVLAISFIDTAQASISSHIWTNPKRRNYTDLYYGYVNVAYERGSTANLLVAVANYYSSDAYFRVRVKMDWASENVTSQELLVKRGETQVFELNISIPSTVSNMYLHSYIIYSEYKFAVNEAWKSDSVRQGSEFAVYSQVQSQALSYKQQLDAYPSYPYLYPTPFLGSAKARELLINASVLKSLGDQAYQTANFEGARNYYKAALENVQKAYSLDTQYLSSLENALVGLMNAGQNYLSFQGIAFLIASVGFLLMGIGVLIYLVRKSKPLPVQTG
ncbi:MAG: hypothetical protein QXY07_03365 [Candidatus Bathyarchaeia archaeon]